MMFALVSCYKRIKHFLIPFYCHLFLDYWEKIQNIFDLKKKIPPWSPVSVIPWSPYFNSKQYCKLINLIIIQLKIPITTSNVSSSIDSVTNLQIYINKNLKSIQTNSKCCTNLIDSFMSFNLRLIIEFLGPNVCPQWSTPK